jgi:hypothetical protein
MLREILIGPQESAEGLRRRSASAWQWSLGLAALHREFPSVQVTIAEAVARGPLVRVGDWRSLAFDPYVYDSIMGRGGAASPSRVYILGPLERETVATAFEFLTRYQCLIGRRNQHSATALFDRVLARHRELHDLSKPLVAADFLHALDVWQWLMRLWPVASLTAQIAALFHDIERLENEAEARREPHSLDYRDFKERHAKEGAQLLAPALRGLGIDNDALGRIRELIARHETPGDDLEPALLKEADALSFFSRSSAAYLDHFGATQAARQVAFALRRLRPRGLQRLKTIRMRADVERMTVRQLRLLHARAAPPFVAS